MLVRDGDRVAQRLRVTAAGPGVVHHVGAVLGRVQHRADRVGGGARTLRIQELDRHDPHVPVHAGDAEAVVARRADRAGDVRAVAVVVHRVVVAVHEVPAAPVVDVAVVVVVDAVAAAAAAVLARVDPDLGAEVRMRPVDARVDHRHGHAGAARRHVPGLRRVDVGIRGPREALDRLAGVVQPPEVPEGRIVRQRVRLDDEVRLCVTDARILAQLVERRRGRVGAHAHQRAVDLLEAPLLGGAEALEDLGLVCRRDVVPETNQQLARHGLRGRLLRGRGLPDGAAQREQGADGGEQDWDATGAVHHLRQGVGAAVRLLLGQ